MNDRPIVIIAHRMGKGQNVAKGIQEAGGQAIVVPGMGADMKLGEFMNKHNADFGISFCGSGGAGAITAANLFGYKQESSLRTIDAGVSALKRGAKALGFGFMDTEELGRTLTNAWKKENQS